MTLPRSPSPRPGSFAITVYFDGSCPLCRREISLYRRLRGAEQLHWVDVSSGQTTGAGLSCEQAMRRFHVRDAQGQLLSGGAAFARLWQALPGWRIAGWLFAWPPMSWLLELAYRGFLPLRPRLQRMVIRWWPDTQASP
ncbi:MAG: thiol-disulfide oxidoreductase DCC family protein [Limnohabitans sp.]